MNGFKEFKLPNDPIFADFSTSICEYGAKENNMQKNIEAFKEFLHIVFYFITPHPTGKSMPEGLPHSPD